MNADQAIRYINHHRERLGITGDATVTHRVLLRAGHTAEAIIDAYTQAVDRGARNPTAWVVGYFRRVRSGGRP